MSIFSDIALLVKDHTTYDVGLMQARGYRTLKHMTALALKPEKLTTAEWAMLGVLLHYPKGLSSSGVAAELGVRQPQVSRLITRAEEGGWINVIQGGDKRERMLVLSTKGKKNIGRIEKNIQKNLIPLLKGVGPRDLAGYLRTLSLITANGSDLPPADFEEYLPE